MLNSAWVYLYIAVGGAVGACLRFFLLELAASLFGREFPVGTLLVNIFGSLLIGVVYTLVDQGHLEVTPWKMLLGIGLIGAFTTFSAFSLDSFLLIQQGAWIKAGLNILLNVTICLTAVWLGSRFAIFIKN